MLLPILLTSKELKRLALLAYYEANTFVFYIDSLPTYKKTYEPKRWLSPRAPERMYIRKLELHLNIASWYGYSKSQLWESATYRETRAMSQRIIAWQGGFVKLDYVKLVVDFQVLQSIAYKKHCGYVDSAVDDVTNCLARDLNGLASKTQGNNFEIQVERLPARLSGMTKEKVANIFRGKMRFRDQ